MWLSFAALGLLIGLLIGLSAESSLSFVIPAIFSLIGGSVIVLLKKLDEKQINQSTTIIGSISAFCIIGLLIGIVTSEYQILSPDTPNRGSEVSDKKYLRNDVVSKVNAIDVQYRQKLISIDEAYKSVLETIRE